MSRESKNAPEPFVVGPATHQMLGLLEDEIARLQQELAAVRAGDHEQRRVLIVNLVARLDERQDALGRLQELIRQAESQA